MNRAIKRAVVSMLKSTVRRKWNKPLNNQDL